jgi:hypothetical protein
MGYKPFSKSLYDTNDNAKDLVIKWLAANGITAWVNPDQYGIDLLSDDKKYEVEVKRNWLEDDFPYDEVHFPARKLKFATPDAVFVMLNHKKTHALLVTGDVFKGSPKVIKSTIYTENEEFIEVLVNKCTIVKLLED